MVESLKQQNEALRAQLKKAQEQLEQQAVMIEQQAITIKQLQAKIFGKKTEVLEQVADGQLSLFDPVDDLTSDQEITEVVKTTTTKVVRHRPVKKQLTRQEFLDQLPQVEEVVPLKTTTCPDCQHKMAHIGKRLARREARLKEPELYCANLYEESYKCKHCSQDGNDKLVTSKAPMALLPHSYFSSSTLAFIAYLKFSLALPFHRQEKFVQGLGLPVNAKQMASNIIKVSQTYLEPLYQYLSNTIRQEPVIHMDETPFKVVDSPKAQDYFWVTRTTQEFAQHQAVVFHHANTRSGRIIGQIVGSNYPGIIMCDGYKGYSNRLYPQAKFGSCLVHIRREFVKLVKGLPKAMKASKAQRAITLLSQAFRAENQLSYQTAREKLAQRQSKVKPLMDKFYAYISQINQPLGQLRNAIANAIQLKPRVYRVFENGQLPLSNNPLEQSIRPSTLIRKNCLFAKTEAGAKANAVYYSLVETAKLNQLNVQRYLNYLFDHLPESNYQDLGAFLPWAKKVQEECHE